MKNPVLISGTSSGVGLGMAQQFLTRGHDVLGSVRTDAKAIELKERLGTRFFPLVFDVRDTDQIARAATTAAEHLGDRRLAALINNAGAAEIGPLLHVPLDHLRRQLDILAVGQLAVTQHFYRHLLPRDGDASPGRIINISSISGMNANRYFGCYAAGKHALEGLSKALRLEMREYGIPVVVVAPGISQHRYGRSRPKPLSSDIGIRLTIRSSAGRSDTFLRRYLGKQ